MTTFFLSASFCAGKIVDANRIAVLTGAGLSTAAGVPDFRGPRGLYVTRAYDPEAVFEIGGFDRDPAPFYRFTRDFLGLLEGIAPTYTHTFLARLEREKPDTAIITQNIDGLHQQAGSKRVFPMHGDYESAHCRSCGQAFTGPELRQRLAAVDIPACDLCGGVIKPDVVFFGEAVRWLGEAERLVASSDLLLVLGSSLTVYPAAALPASAGGEVVVVNRGPVGLSARGPVWVVDSDLDEYFRAVADNLGWK